MGFWRRKSGSDFISLGLNTPLEPTPAPAEDAAMPAPAEAIIEQPAVATVAVEPVEDESFVRRFRRAVASTRESFVTRLEDVVKGKKEIDASTLDELEEALIGADIGVQTTM